MTRARCLACLLLAATAARGQDEMRAVEARTEAFARQLLELTEAVRQGNEDRVAALFAPRVRANGALLGGPPRRETEWIQRLEWRLEAPRDHSALAFARRLLGFVGAHERVDAIEFQPSRSQPDGERLHALVKYHIVGRGVDRGGVWTRGTAAVVVHKGRIEQFELRPPTTLVSDRVVFREVGVAAGLTGTDPAVLDHPTLGLAAYGAAAADVDGDGDIDIFSTGHKTNLLFSNRGDGTFEPREVKSPRRATGPLFLDYDNDGDPDLFLSAHGKQMLLRNDGAGNFRDVSSEAGVDKESIAFSAAAGDINGDGIPDIYVTAYNNYGPVAPGSWDEAQDGLPNLLFVSRGDGRGYEEAAVRWGVADRRWSYAAQFADLDGDGRLDLYVANDFGGGNRLYLRREDRFEDKARQWRVRDDGYGMGVSISDYDNDGHLDLHVTKMSSTAGRRILQRFTEHSLAAKTRLERLAAGNSLYRNTGRGGFEDVSAAAGPFAGGWAWGGGFVDIDNDGREDLHTPNGFLSGASKTDT